MLYGFDETDVRRLRRLLAAFEDGRISQSTPYVPPARADARDTRYVKTVSSIAANAVGAVHLVSVDRTASPPTTSVMDALDGYELWNTTSATIPANTLLPAVREPASGLLLPVVSGGGALTLKDKLGVTVDAACTTLLADTNGVLTWHFNSTGNDTIVIAAASPTQYGVVSTIGQKFDGAKDFLGQVGFENAGVWLGTGTPDSVFLGTSISTQLRATPSSVLSPTPYTFGFDLKSVVGGLTGIPVGISYFGGRPSGNPGPDVFVIGSPQAGTTAFTKPIYAIDSQAGRVEGQTGAFVDASGNIIQVNGGIVTNLGAGGSSITIDGGTWL